MESETRYHFACGRAATQTFNDCTKKFMAAGSNSDFACQCVISLVLIIIIIIIDTIIVLIVTIFLITITSDVNIESLISACGDIVDYYFSDFSMK